MRREGARGRISREPHASRGRISTGAGADATGGRNSTNPNVFLLKRGAKLTDSPLMKLWKPDYDVTPEMLDLAGPLISDSIISKATAIHLGLHPEPLDPEADRRNEDLFQDLIDGRIDEDTMMRDWNYSEESGERGDADNLINMLFDANSRGMLTEEGLSEMWNRATAPQSDKGTDRPRAGRHGPLNNGLAGRSPQPARRRQSSRDNRVDLIARPAKQHTLQSYTRRPDHRHNRRPDRQKQRVRRPPTTGRRELRVHWEG